MSNTPNIDAAVRKGREWEAKRARENKARIELQEQLAKGFTEPTELVDGAPREHLNWWQDPPEKPYRPAPNNNFVKPPTIKLTANGASLDRGNGLAGAGRTEED